MIQPKPKAKPVDALALAQDLVRCPSVTPEDAGTLDLLTATLEAMGFTCHRLPFSSGDEDAIDNLYARIGEGRPNFGFAGHVDVVPPGDEAAWTFPPFSGRISGGFLKGRGSADMKGAIAAFVAALSRFLIRTEGKFKGSLSLLITGDEEARAKNGTKRVLAWMRENGEALDLCLLGEPTNPGEIGEMIKIGRRGSLNVTLTVPGRQTHVAYPERGANPIPRLHKILDALQRWKIDDGTKAFQPSNLEVTNLHAGTGVFNVIPAAASAKFNIRFNDRHTADSLIAAIETRCEKTGIPHTLGFDPIGEAFVTSSLALAETVKAAVKEVLGREAEFSTTGGASDGRFIKDLCPVAEFGLSGATMHAVDERVPIKDIEALTRVYERVLEKIALYSVGLQEHIARSLYVAWRVFAGDASALKFLEVSGRGVLRSFSALLFAAPAFFLIEGVQLRGPDFAWVGAWHYFGLFAAYAAAWPLFALAAFYFHKGLGPAENFLRFASLYNWGRVYVLLLLLPAFALSGFGLVEGNLKAGAFGVSLAAALAYAFAIARMTLGLPVIPSALLVLLDAALATLLDALAFSAFGHPL